MNTLFPAEPVYPEGFSYFPNFITEKEEQELCNEVLRTELHTFNFQGFEAKRKVASFGYDYSFSTRSLSKGKEIPASFHSLITKVGEKVGVAEKDFAELLVTEYPAGAVINWHRDAPPFDLIAGISLHADCVFRLRPHDKAKQTRPAVISFPVKRRSLYVIRGPARADWQHSIAPVKQVRYSITLRTLRAR
ncbi:MAG TPA: alpha-ketoglutarate-dependent dioxygenase AlkB [Chitinophagaceae bacterium]|nr:alpha-ketoglutarate-dependent dioxygenase AlkB [Chitinophagaceae bacterium]